MKVAYATVHNPLDVQDWSGTSYHIGLSLRKQGLDVDYLGPLEDRLQNKVVRKCKRHYYELFGRKYLRDPEPFILKNYAAQISQKICNTSPDVIFSATSNPIAYLATSKPTAFWADATFAGISEFYPHYSDLCKETIQDWNKMERLAIQNCSLAIYASDWAAQTAVDTYEADPAKVKVVPFGANVQWDYSLEDIKDLIAARPHNYCKLLFLGIDWHRKGGDVAFQVAQQLNQSGLKTELTVVGCQPPIKEPVPPYINQLGFISKADPQGLERIRQLIAETHLLIVPSYAECYGIVFCEANSLGIPCISTKVGGIPTVVKEDVNGKLFNSRADISLYCDYISDLFHNYSNYKRLALSSFNEYQSRLNWEVAGKSVRQLLENL